MALNPRSMFATVSSLLLPIDRGISMKMIQEYHYSLPAHESAAEENTLDAAVNTVSVDTENTDVEVLEAKSQGDDSNHLGIEFGEKNLREEQSKVLIIDG